MKGYNASAYYCLLAERWGGKKRGRGLRMGRGEEKRGKERKLKSKKERGR